jgi:hypothetical protein
MLYYTGMCRVHAFDVVKMQPPSPRLQRLHFTKQSMGNIVEFCSRLIIISLEITPKELLKKEVGTVKNTTVLVLYLLRRW